MPLSLIAYAVLYLQDICEADSAVLCDKLADSISSSMGGTSGALLEILFRAAATFLSTKVLKSKVNHP